jgi:hypothetical protein
MVGEQSPLPAGRIVEFRSGASAIVSGDEHLSVQQDRRRVFAVRLEHVTAFLEIASDRLVDQCFRGLAQTYEQHLPIVQQVRAEKRRWRQGDRIGDDGPAPAGRIVRRRSTKSVAAVGS